MLINNKGKPTITLLDNEDEIFFSKWKWHTESGYAARGRRKSDGPGTHIIFLHREVLKRQGIEVPNGMVTDHINRDKLDNRRKNLRIATKRENALNVSEEVRAVAIRNLVTHRRKVPMTLENRKRASENMKKQNALGHNKTKGAEHHKSKKVMNTKTGQIYGSCKEAATAIGMNNVTLSTQLRGKVSNKTDLIYMVNLEGKNND